MDPGQLSKTAAFIAIKFYGLTRSEPLRGLFPDSVLRFYEQLVPALPAPLRYYHPLLRSSAPRRFFIFWEELLLPGDLMHIVLRKYYMQQWVQQLYERGYRQMVVLGAGFDHLGSCWAPRGLQILELDTPRMTAVKQSFIHKKGYNHRGLHLQEALLPDHSLAGILESSPLEPNHKTVIVAEGFFDYLTPADGDTVLRHINHYFQGEVTLLSTIFALDSLTPFYKFVYTNSIRLAGEKLRMHYSRDEYIAFLGKRGYNADHIITPHDMQRQILDPRDVPHPVLEGFFIVQAERNGADLN